jgi:hypothetical protein
MDNNGLLRRTLVAWFSHNVQPSATARALFIHRKSRSADPQRSLIPAASQASRCWPFLCLLIKLQRHIQ